MKCLHKKIAVVLLSLITTFVSFAQTTSEQWYDKAEKLFDDKKYKEASVAYEKIISLNPKDTFALYKVGWCYNDLEQFDKAIDRLKKAVALDEYFNEAWQELGWAYKKSDKNEDALICFKKLIELNATPYAYKQLGDVYQNLGKDAEAILAYKKCYENDNKNDDACYNLGYLYNEMAEYTTALEWLKKGNDLKKRVDIYNEIGFANYKLQKNGEAIRAYQNALELNEKNGTAYKGLGDVYRLNFSPAKVDDAMTNYVKAIENNPKSSGSNYGLGWCYNDKGRYEEAIPLLIKSIELDRTFGAGYTELGYAQYMTEKYKEGLNTLKAGLAQDNKSSLCRYYSGLIYVKQGDKTNAFTMYNELKPLDAKLADKLLVKINAL